MEREQAEAFFKSAGADAGALNTLDLLHAQADPPVYRVQTSSLDAMFLWQDLVTATRGAAWPIILGSADDVSILCDLPPRPAAQHLEDAAGRDAVALLDEWRQNYLANANDPELQEERDDIAALIAEVEADPDTQWLARADADAPVPPAEPFPGEEFMRSSVADGYKGKEQIVSVALVPTPVPAEVFAYLNFGGYNDCPRPAEHVAVHRRWASLYGAEIFACSGDVIESRVRRPPTTYPAALALALEHYFYCPDIVDQGVGSIAELAKHLMNRPQWFFWWD